MTEPSDEETETTGERGASLDLPMLIEDVGSDPILQVLVATVDKNREAAVGMTLAANGCLVSGLLVGERRWFTDLEIAHPDLRESFTTPLRRAMVDEPHETGKAPSDQPLYVHLKDARYIGGSKGPIPNGQVTGFFWRGRIEHISAWSFGLVADR